MEKPFKVHNVRPIINQLMNKNIKDEDRISFSRSVEMLNEIAFKYQCAFKSRYGIKKTIEINRSEENGNCTFAEWFHRHALDDKNGGYYMHFNSGMEVNKLYNIVEIYNYFKNEKK